MIHACHLSFELLSDFIRSLTPSTATDFFRKKCHKQSPTIKFNQDRESLTGMHVFIIYCIFWYPENIQMWRKNGTRGPRPHPWATTGAYAIRLRKLPRPTRKA